MTNVAITEGTEDGAIGRAMALVFGGVATMEVEDAEWNAEAEEEEVKCCEHIEGARPKV